MRARNIKPGFFKNEEIAEVEPLGRLLFIGLWSIADREGKLEDRPKRIKAELFPYDDYSHKKIDALLNELQRYNLIQRYIVEGNRYVKVLNFLKHQRPHDNEIPSEIPEPLVTLVESPCIQGEKHFEPNEQALRSSTLNDVSLNYECTAMCDSEIALTGKNRNNGANHDFEMWWKVFPTRRKTGKPQALAKWKTLQKNKSLLPVAQMLAILEKQKSSYDWTKNGGEYVPGPVPYLNKLRFLDESLEIKENICINHSDRKGVSKIGDDWFCRECLNKYDANKLKVVNALIQGEEN